MLILAQQFNRTIRLAGCPLDTAIFPWAFNNKLALVFCKSDLRHRQAVYRTATFR